MTMHPTPPCHRPEAQPTLLVFTRGRRQGRRLLPAALAGLEAEVYHRCLESALRAGVESGCRVVVASPDGVERLPGAAALAQRGRGFGERLAHAWAEGSVAAGPVVVVPSDVPGLTAEHVGRTRSILAADPEAVVVGPSPDGGLYLLAAGRPLPPALLRRVRWCRRQTRAELLHLLRLAGRRVVLLEALGDLDQPADLERWLAEPCPSTTRWVGLRGRLRTALRAQGAAASTNPLLPSSPARRPFAGRAPPRRSAA